MPRLAGIDLPVDKRTQVALTYIYGIGRRNVNTILGQASVNPDKRAKDLSQEEITRLQHAIDRVNTEGELKKQIRESRAEFDAGKGRPLDALIVKMKKKYGV